MLHFAKSSTLAVLSLRRVQPTSVRALSTVAADLGRNKALGEKAEAKKKDSGISGAANTRPKRFYKEVTVAPATAVKSLGTTEGYCILLDGRALRTPRRLPLVHGNTHLMYALAEEWDAQKEDIVVHTMPLNRMTNTVVDKIHNANDMIKNCLAYYMHDTVCCRTDEPAKLAQLMDETWAAPVQEFSKVFGDVAISRSIGSPAQTEATQAAVRAFLEAQSYPAICAYSELVHRLKSFVLAWNIAHGHMSDIEAVKASRVEENCQIQEWGEVEGAHDIDEAAVWSNVSSTHFFLKNYH